MTGKNDEEKKNPLSDAIARVTESDAYDRLTDVTAPIGRHVRDVCDGISGAMMRLSNDGYDSLDIWNLGDAEVEHVSKVVNHLADVYERQGTIDGERARRMRRHAEVMSKRGDLLETVGNASLIHPFSNYRTVNGNRVHLTRYLRVSEREIDREFLRSWDWFGERFLTERYVAPRTETHSVLDVIDKASGGVAWIDYSDYPAFELRRVSSMLRDFLHGNIGYPDGYSKRQGVVDHGKEWADSTALWGMFVSDDVREKSHEHKHDDGTTYYSSPTNHEYGDDFAAWSDDISYVAGVFDQWRETMALDGKTNSKAFRVVRDATRGEFLRCWHWMGENIDAIWW